jgi:hypothetical protein
VPAVAVLHSYWWSPIEGRADKTATFMSWCQRSLFCIATGGLLLKGEQKNLQPSAVVVFLQQSIAAVSDIIPKQSALVMEVTSKPNIRRFFSVHAYKSRQQSIVVDQTSSQNTLHFGYGSHQHAAYSALQFDRKKRITK